MTAEEAIALGALQKPRELAWMLGQLKDRTIGSVLEIGCYTGGMTRVWRSLGAGVTCIDPQNEGQLADDLKADSLVRLIQGYSTDEGVVELLDDHYDVVYIDGDHSPECVRSDWETFGPMARVAVIFHDIVPWARSPDEDDHWTRGVCELWAEIWAFGNTSEFIDPTETLRADGRLMEKRDGGVGIAWMK